MIPLSSYRPAAEDRLAYISSTPLDLAEIIKGAHDPKAGAVVVFSGDVRELNSGKEVSYLEYEAHIPMACRMIESILQEASLRWSLIVAMAQHRIGKVQVGESAVVVVTGSTHRKEAYEANRYIIDKIKHEAPIWKCEYYADGSREWGGNCNCSKITGDVGKHLYDFELQNGG